MMFTGIKLKVQGCSTRHQRSDVSLGFVPFKDGMGWAVELGSGGVIDGCCEIAGNFRDKNL